MPLFRLSRPLRLVVFYGLVGKGGANPTISWVVYARIARYPMDTMRVNPIYRITRNYSVSPRKFAQLALEIHTFFFKALLKSPREGVDSPVDAIMGELQYVL